MRRISSPPVTVTWSVCTVKVACGAKWATMASTSRSSTALKKLAGRDASRSRVRVMFGGLDVQIGKSVITVGEFQMKIAVWIKWQIVKISGGLVPVLGKFNQQSAKVRYYQ